MRAGPRLAQRKILRDISIKSSTRLMPRERVTVRFVFWVAMLDQQGNSVSLPVRIVRRYREYCQAALPAHVDDHQAEPDAEEVEQMLDDYVRTEGNPEVVQFSGGEPTIHPQIIDFVRAAKNRDIPFVMINTNGKRIANDNRFLEQLNEVRPSLYFQFDGFDSETYRTLRGEPDILEEKLRALDRLAQIGLNVTIVPAIERGVNKHEVGKIIDFAIRHPAIRGINFQPAFHAGRHAAHDPMQRMTIPDVLQLIESQTAEKFKVSDFVPVPCCFPTCNSVTYAFIDGEHVTPLPRIVNVYDYLDYITCRVSVYSERGKTKIGMMKPSAMLKALSDSPALADVAREVKKTIIEMISEAK
jgi:pyruvate-formate lyase-activating enzyme